MSFEIPDGENKKDSTKNYVEKEKEINNTASFLEAINNAQLEQAENWLMENRDRADARYLDHRSRELFKAYRQNQDWSAAKRMVELASNETGRQGRIDVLEKESGLSYDKI